MSWRRLRVLIQHLPPESHTMTALRNTMSAQELAAQAEKGEPEKARWSQQEQLTASLVDAVRRVEWVLWCVNSEKNKEPDPPEPMRRPGAGPKKQKAKLTEKSADRLFHLLNGGAA
ncbi:hypothetical protein PV724_44355 [Streptomyces europaeiscabiei]|uniref:hypothetical protein n=1 Tax=Streptomyces europaeiscabiei TaxID=146819 RepID=UPI0029BF10C0|nr:hypothetical protein [Streptomyces europaeiscabiei]MDX3549511.1 hypothetical protein [Streptomyces europaeiscabiei]